MTALAIAGLVWWWALRRGIRPERAALAGWGLVAAPLPASAAASVVVASRRWRRAAVRTRERDAADADVVVLYDLVALGVASGKTLRGATEAARSHLHPRLAAEVDLLLEDMDDRGSAPALVGAHGRLAEFGRVVGAAMVSGAPVQAAVTAAADRERHARHAARVAAARRLPVRLLLPLALLILPGFVVLAVGPAVLQALARLAPIP